LGFEAPGAELRFMTLTIALTGFGPFPGAPFNPTELLVERLAYRRHPAFVDVRRIAHVFPTRYDGIDEDLPKLLAGERPDVLVMFGLAPRSRHVRVETRARNTLASMLPDAGGRRPIARVIAPGGPSALSLPAPVQRLAAAARSSGVPTALSRDAGRYLCNYLCWRASEAVLRAGGPRMAAFIHVPAVRLPSGLRPSLRRIITLDDLIRAGEAVVLAALAAARLPSG
jgi:pyroglutamyl-peptidase